MRRLSNHPCHAEGCNREIHPRRLMCGKHWRMVPEWLKAAIWATYVPGQWVKKNPTREYLVVQARACLAVALIEKEPTEPCWKKLKISKFIPRMKVAGMKRRDAVKVIDDWIKELTEAVMASQERADAE